MSSLQLRRIRLLSRFYFPVPEQELCLWTLLWVFVLLCDCNSSVPSCVVFLERLQLHGVIVVLLNISAAEKHKVFCAVSGFRRGQKTHKMGKHLFPLLLCFTHSRTKDVFFL